MRKTAPAATDSNWSLYSESAVHYSSRDHTTKQEFVGRVLETVKPERVLDVGCNSGVYSRMAADQGAEVVAIDTDVASVDRLCASIAGKERNILPLCVDLARPTPAVGWENRENAAFLDRCEGSFDMVVMLAVMHHLLVGNQIPLDRIAALCDSITSRHLILEWVPPDDVKFRQIARGRDALYSGLTERSFRKAFAQFFQVVGEARLENDRLLVHFEKR